MMTSLGFFWPYRPALVVGTSSPKTVEADQRARTTLMTQIQTLQDLILSLCPPS